MLDKIGIIGNTHGVKDSNKPAAKKPAMTNHKLPLFNAVVVLSSLLSTRLEAAPVLEPVFTFAALFKAILKSLFCGA